MIILGFVLALFGAVLVVASPAVGAPVKWNSSWVWVSGEDLQTRQNLHVYFRREFHLEGAARQAEIKVSADSRYILYVNGHEVGRGPLKGDLAHYYYETYDLRRLLKPGDNVIAVHVHLNTGLQSEVHSGRGGFLCQGAIETPHGQRVDLDTPGAWKATAHTGWRDNRNQRTGFLAYVNDFDARPDPQGWMRSGFDDSGWETPVYLGPPDKLPWRLHRRDIPQMRQTLVRPQAVTDTGRVLLPGLLSALQSSHIDFLSLYHQDHAVGYAWTYLHAQNACTATMGVGSDDSVAVWLNGKELMSKTIVRAAMPHADEVTLHLDAGWNELLVKVGQEVAGWELITDLPARAGGGPIVINAGRQLQANPQTWRVAGPFDEASLKDFRIPQAPETSRQPNSEYAGKNGPVRWQLIDVDPVTSHNWAESREELPFTADASRIQGARRFAAGGRSAIGIRPETNVGAQFTLDFGREMTGAVRFRVSGKAGSVIELRYAEHPGAYIGAPDVYVLRDGDQQFQGFHYMGYRYVTVTTRELTGPLTIRSLDTVFMSYPLVDRGSFRCSDPLLNRIWDVGRYTTMCCLHETYEDCPGFEQLQYWGDARVETLVSMVAFGDSRPFARGLKLLSWSRQPDGILYSRYPCSEQQIIPTFSLIWILSQSDYMKYVGDKQLIKGLWPTTEGVLSWFEKRVGPDGALTDVPDWVFIDWAGELGNWGGGKSSILNAFYYRALVQAADLADMLGKPQDARNYREQAAKLKDAFNKVFWSDKLGAYVDGVVDGKQDGRLSQHAQAVALLFDLVPPGRESGVVREMLRPGITQATPYFMFYVFQALAHTGHYEHFLDQVRRWKAMLDSGATTWWEQWDNPRSWCHAWSSAPTYELSTRVLGILPTAAGFRKALIQPHFGDLQWAEGSVPTPYGDIHVSWKRSGAKTELTYSAPKGIKVDVDVPEGTIVRVGRE